MLIVLIVKFLAIWDFIAVDMNLFVRRGGLWLISLTIVFK